MAGLTELVKSTIYTGNATKSINTTGGDAVMLLTHSAYPITGATIGGKALTALYNGGNASVWYLKLPTTGSTSLIVSGSSSITYGYYLLKNAGDIRFHGTGYFDNYSGGGYIDIPIATAYTSPGNLCLGLATSTRAAGTYFSKQDTTQTWQQLSGTVAGDDGRIIHISHMKTTSGGAEEYNIGFAYGGFRTIAVVVDGYDISSFSFSTLL